MRQTLLNVAKFAIPALILGWLVYSVRQSNPDLLAELAAQEKNWGLLAGAFACVLASVSLTFLRWHALLAAVNLPISVGEAFRLGFLGYLFNFVSPGAVGGDLFKAVFIAHHHAERKTLAVATVVVDRAFGLAGLLLVAAAAIFLLPGESRPGGVLLIGQIALGLSVLFFVGMTLALTPAFAAWSLWRWAERLPWVGASIEHLVEALRLYRQNLGTLAAATGMSLLVHLLNVFAIYLASQALFEQTPSLAEHLVIGPVSLTAGAIPFLPGGLGAFEGAMQLLFGLFSPPQAPEGMGLVVAFAWRGLTILVAAVGVVFYWASRGEVQAVLEEANEEADGAPAATEKESEAVPCLAAKAAEERGGATASSPALSGRGC